VIHEQGDTCSGGPKLWLLLVYIAQEFSLNHFKPDLLWRKQIHEAIAKKLHVYM
jgi:hypothetical protein